MRKLLFVVILAIGIAAPSSASAVEFRSLDGSGNNLNHRDWGQVGTQYARVAPPNYADGVSTMVYASNAKRSPRSISNRIFNDTGVTLFSEGQVSQFGWLWGQFVDHTLDLRNETNGEQANIPFNQSDPLESFVNQTASMEFFRTPAAPGSGTGTDNPRQQINTVNSFIDAFQVYGGTTGREEWLRTGPVDGNLANNGPSLMLPGGYLPRADARGDVSAAPAMDLMGPLNGRPQNAIVAGDVRANENMGLTSLQTLFAREHNRIVALLPTSLSAQMRFDIARRVVGAEEQYITYNEFLPAMGVHLPAYGGYDDTVDPTITNEFATVGFRGHSAVNGELQAIAPPGYWSAARLQSFEDMGIEQATLPDGNIELTISMTLAFGNPSLLTQVGEGPLLKGMAANVEYNNDEQIDNKFRSILFQLPAPGTDPATCVGDTAPPGCFLAVQDLGAIDVQRARDHGIPTYNQLRVAYGLAPARSYTDITDEWTADLPPEANPLDPMNDPVILSFDAFRDRDGNYVTPGPGVFPTAGERRATMASRLKGIYGAGNVDKVDAFVGMLCEPHVNGTELGPLQLAIWTKQFEALRDGDRFFYLNGPYLTTIRRNWGVDYRQTLANVIALDTDSTTQPFSFSVDGLG